MACLDSQEKEFLRPVSVVVQADEDDDTTVFGREFVLLPLRHALVSIIEVIIIPLIAMIQ